jgi:hypothetical protein
MVYDIASRRRSYVLPNRVVQGVTHVVMLDLVRSEFTEIYSIVSINCARVMRALRLKLLGLQRRPQSRQIYFVAAFCIGATSLAGNRYLHWKTMSNSVPLDAKLKAPRTPMQWDHSPSSIESITASSIDRSRALLDEVAALSPAECNFNTVFRRLADDETSLETITGPLQFYQYVSTDEGVRDAANAAEVRLNEFGIESSMRVDVFKALKAAKENIDKSGKKLGAEEERLVVKMLLDGKRNGLDLPEETRNELTQVRPCNRS